MKTAIICATLALLGAAAHAEIVATTPTDDGGAIKLTSESCTPRPGMLFMYTTTGSGAYFTGCWQLIDSDVFVVYGDGSKRMYNLDGFTLRPKPSGKATRRKGSL